MNLSKQLQRDLDIWIQDVETYCTEANGALDDLEAYGKEPTLDAEFLNDLASSDSVYTFSTDSIERELEPEPTIRHRQLRLNLAAQPQAQDLASADDISEILSLAHSEDVDLWMRAIAGAMSGRARVGFRELLYLSGLKPSELLIGLLLGSWVLMQQSFYGEIEISQAVEGFE